MTTSLRDQVRGDMPDLDDEFPMHLRWSVYVDNTCKVVAANQLAARFAALMMVRLMQDEPATMWMVGPHVVNDHNVGIRFPLFRNALVADAANIRTDYARMRMDAAADDLVALADDVRAVAAQAREASRAIDVLRSGDQLTAARRALIALIAVETLQRYEGGTFSVKTGRDYVIFGGTANGDQS